MLSQRDVDRIIFGCGNFGGIGSSPRLQSAGDGESKALEMLDHGRRVGVRRFDTANSYGGGASEAILGKWLRAQGPAFVQNAQIATKVGNPNACPTGETPLSAAQIAFHLDRSLDRLGLDRIDLYYIHEFDRVTPLEETLEAMERAVAAGKIDRFGISNARLEDVEAVRRQAPAGISAAFEYVQNEYNLLATADADALIPYCAEHGLRYTAFSPLAGGFLTGKYRRGEPPPGDSRFAQAPEVCGAYSSDDAFEKIEQLRREADRRQLGMAEAALRFVLETPGVDGLIIAPRKIEHFTAMGLEPQ